MDGSDPAATDGVQGLEPHQLGVYFALMEAVSLLQHQVARQLRAEGDLSYVQFELLARLTVGDGPLTMTQLADGVVYSRSGLTYQAGLLEQAGLITRVPSADDERATLVSITEAGAALVGRVLPGHVEVVRRLLFEPLSGDDVKQLGDIMPRVRDHMRAQPPRSATPRKRRRETGVGPGAATAAAGEVAEVAEVGDVGDVAEEPDGGQAAAPAAIPHQES